MNEKIISGLQQIGIGVKDVHTAWAWYKKYFGFDVRVFEETAMAELMLPYTGGKPQKRHAALAINLQGGGGFEIWQYTDRIPVSANFDIGLGDLGLFAAKIKCRNVKATYEWFKSEGLNLLSEVHQKDGVEHFFVRDPFNNIFQIVGSTNWFQDKKIFTGGSYGAVIGVSDIEKSRKFYNVILGYDEVVSDVTAVFDDFSGITGGNHKFRRVILSHSKSRLGAFSKLLGTSQIELVQVLDREPVKIFYDRFWGDLGFIHLCFDIYGMDIIRQECKAEGCSFTVDTGDSFDMGEAAGAFAYIEDPDGTLIEFVETHKIPIAKKFGIYLNLVKRDHKKSLPNWMLKALSLNKANDIKIS
jgi:catechol 2,3-dioxygenase-like lactoylglutathione lyase family enzyme